MCGTDDDAGDNTEVSMATIQGTFMDGLYEVLMTLDEDAVDAILTRTFGCHDQALIPLVCQDLSCTEALAYARVLAELGDETQARELLTEVIRHAAGELPPGFAAASSVQLAA